MMLLLRDAACAAVFCVFSVSSAAALTAEEVWADWQRLAGGGQVALTATATRDGDRLVLTDVTFPFGTATSNPDRVTLERIELQELPDGRVAVLLPDRFPVVINNGNTASSGPTVVTLSASAPGFSMIIADIGEKTAFEVTAPSLTLSLDKVEPALGINELIDLNFALADLSLQYRIDVTQRSMAAAMRLSIGTAHGDLLVQVDDPEQPKMDISVDLAALSGTYNLVIPPFVFEELTNEEAVASNPLPQILDAIGDGLAVNMEVTYKTFALNANVEDPGNAVQIDITSASGRGLGKLDAESAEYDFTLGKTMLDIDRAAPAPTFQNVIISVEELGYGAYIGIGDPTTPQEARLNYRIVDLILPPEIWAQVDPTGALGTSPLTFVLDIASRYALGPEMLQPDWKPTPGVLPPIDIVVVTLTDFVISGLGVDLGGGGSLTFDETDLVTFDGLPAPDGKLSFMATGLNAFIDRAVAAGLIPQEELTGLRLGLAFIAKPGAEPDSLETEIEFRDKGLFLNGQQIR
jgi:hypothetical protein